MPQELLDQVQELMDAQVIRGFTRPAQWVAHAMREQIKRDLELSEKIARATAAPSPNSATFGGEQRATPSNGDHSEIEQKVNE